MSSTTISRECSQDSDVSHPERILVVTRSDESFSKLARSLRARSHEIQRTLDLEAADDMASREYFDIVVVESLPEDSKPLRALLEEVATKMSLNLTPIVLAHPQAASLREEDLPREGIHVVDSPLNPTLTFVKISTVLRLRKMAREQVSFDTTIAQKNAELEDLTQRFRRELEEAKGVKEAILPKTPPQFPGVETAFLRDPLEEVGGDLLDIWEIKKGFLGLFMADVTGIGLPAAFVSAMTKMALNYTASLEPDAILREMNEGIFDHLPAGRFVTVAAAVYCAENCVLRLACGGHPPGLLYRASSKEAELLDPQGPALGVAKNAVYSVLERRLEPGDRFVLLSDGITESTNMDGKTLGSEGAKHLFLETAASPSISDCLSAILKKRAEFSGGRRRRDDSTLLGLEKL